MSSSVTGDPFWVNKFNIIIEKPTEFFPIKSQTLSERLNAIVRFGLYISILLTIYYGDLKYISIFVFILFLTYIIHSNAPKKVESSVETFNESSTQSVSPITANSIIGTTSTSENCVKPTKDNPFMNVTMKDYMNFDKDGNTINREPACDPTDPNIKTQMDDAFNNDLYRDVSDVFGKLNSQRNYFTMPWTTIPNKQDQFANWLYKNPYTCKENQDACINQNYEDLRSNRPQFPNPTVNPISTKKMEAT